MRTKTPEQADKILQAAGHLFGRQRFHEVRMEDIAAEAEVGKGTLYRYFSDKEELYVALVARAADHYLARLRHDVDAVEGARAKLEAVVESVVSYFDENPHLFDLIQRAEVMVGPGFPWKKVRDEAVTLVEQLFTDSRAAGDFVDDPQLTTLLLLGGLRAIIRFGRQPRPRNLARRIVSAFLPTRATTPLAARAR